MTMNFTTRLAAAAVLSALGSLAFAQEAVQDSTWITPSTLSRADAQAATEAGLRNAPRTTTSNTVVPASSPALSRAQVLAEAREAMRLGVIPVTEANAGRVATPAEAEQIRQAGLRAIQHDVAAK
jgi:hypothetical protein